MIDEGFHLTPLDVRRYDFGKALRGYDPQRVEQFREQVATELERLARQTQELEAKLRSFQEQLRSFRERDKALNDALVSAQQLREEIRGQTQREAVLILREARSAADRQLEEARSDLRRVEEALVSMERSRRAFQPHDPPPRGRGRAGGGRGRGPAQGRRGAGPPPRRPPPPRQSRRRRP